MECWPNEAVKTLKDSSSAQSEASTQNPSGTEATLEHPDQLLQTDSMQPKLQLFTDAT